MEIKLDCAQAAAVKVLLDLGHNQDELFHQFVNVGILFFNAPSSNRDKMMRLLYPKLGS